MTVHTPTTGDVTRDVCQNRRQLALWIRRIQRELVAHDIAGGLREADAKHHMLLSPSVQRLGTLPATHELAAPLVCVPQRDALRGAARVGERAPARLVGRADRHRPRVLTVLLKREAQPMDAKSISKTLRVDASAASHAVDDLGKLHMVTLRVSTVEVSLSEQELFYLLGFIDTVLLPLRLFTITRHAADEHEMDRRTLELLHRELTAEILATRWLIGSEYAQFVLTQDRASLVGRGLVAAGAAVAVGAGERVGVGVGRQLQSDAVSAAPTLCKNGGGRGRRERAVSERARGSICAQSKAGEVVAVETTALSVYNCASVRLRWRVQRHVSAF